MIDEFHGGKITPSAEETEEEVAEESLAPPDPSIAEMVNVPSPPAEPVVPASTPADESFWETPGMPAATSAPSPAHSVEAQTPASVPEVPSDEVVSPDSEPPAETVAETPMVSQSPETLSQEPVAPEIPAPKPPAPEVPVQEAPFVEEPAVTAPVVEMEMPSIPVEPIDLGASMSASMESSLMESQPLAEPIVSAELESSPEPQPPVESVASIEVPSLPPEPSPEPPVQELPSSLSVQELAPLSVEKVAVETPPEEELNQHAQQEEEHNAEAAMQIAMEMFAQGMGIEEILTTGGFESFPEHLKQQIRGRLQQMQAEREMQQHEMAKQTREKAQEKSGIAKLFSLSVLGSVISKVTMQKINALFSQQPHLQQQIQMQGQALLKAGAQPDIEFAKSQVQIAAKAAAISGPTQQPEKNQQR